MCPPLGPPDGGLGAAARGHLPAAGRGVEAGLRSGGPGGGQSGAAGGEKEKRGRGEGEEGPGRCLLTERGPEEAWGGSLRGSPPHTRRFEGAEAARWVRVSPPSVLNAPRKLREVGYLFSINYFIYETRLV